MDTKTPYLGTDKLGDYLLLYQSKRDRAMGLQRPGKRTRALLDTRRVAAHRQAVDLASAAFLDTLIKECQAEIGRLIDEADTPEARRAALPEAERLNKLAAQAMEQLDKIAEARHG